VAARADAGIQCAERLGGNVLEDHQARHVTESYIRNTGFPCPASS
jgi:hypothetical protein